MKRSGFKAKGWAPRPAKTIQYEPRAREPARGVVLSGEVRPVLKECALQHEGYMAAVRKLPCARCGVVGFTQFCHADEGKGMGIKTDCRLGWPGCGPHGDEPGCHWFVGTSGRMKREDRRAFEAQAGLEARREVAARGWWPAALPPWPADVTPSGQAAPAAH